jgi:hypothetical protein
VRPICRDILALVKTSDDGTPADILTVASREKLLWILGLLKLYEIINI